MVSNLASVLSIDVLEKKLEDAVNYEPDAVEVETEDGETIESEYPETIQQSIIEDRVADTLAEYISNQAVKLQCIQDTDLSYGSGDTGRQSELHLIPTDNTSKQQLKEIGKDLTQIIKPVFPSSYKIGISHRHTIDDSGRSHETDNFSLFFAYNIRSSGSPRKPAGDSTEVLSYVKK